MSLDEDVQDLARTLLHHAPHMDEEALQQGMEHLREIRRAYTQQAYALECVLRSLEQTQSQRLKAA